MDKEIKGRLPPFTEALTNHTKEKQFPFDTPGHPVSYTHLTLPTKLEV